MNNINQQVGKKILAIRTEKDLYQRELADKAGLPVRTIGRVERGEVDVRLSSLVKICTALNISIKDLFR
jgi:transcriptional regulator with XRE-family HTH domain